MKMRYTPRRAGARAPTARRRASFDPAANAWLGYFLILPTLLLIGLLVLYPLGRAVYMSLTNRTFINPQPEFVGLKNYFAIVQSEAFWEILGNSLAWTLSVIVFQFILGLGTALLLNRRFRGRAIARGMVILPWITPGVIAALLWRLMYEPHLGIINGVLSRVGVGDPTTAWLAEVSTAMPAVILAGIWKGTPFSILMYMAALQTVSDELIDAATIDGAGGWSRLRYVIIPEIMPTIRVTILLTTVWTFNYFDLIYVMTNGGPLYSTHIFPTFIYQLAFAQIQTGLAAAYGIISSVILAIFALLYIRELTKRKVLD